MARRIDKDAEIDAVFPISHRAEKSIDLQVNTLAKENLHIGESKHEVYEAFKGEHGSITAHDRGQTTGFHSWGTYHKYRNEFKTFAHYCRAEHNVKRIENITPQMARSFMHELADLGYAKNTVNSFCSAIEKFGAFLRIDFHAELKDYKRSEDYKGLEDKDIGTRAYENPVEIIGALQKINANDITVAKTTFSTHLALNYGLRINDACHFRLEGNEIFFNSKNGMKTVKSLLPEDAVRARMLIDDKGKYNLSTNTMKSCWEKACAVAGVSNTGFHGLRHGFCQNLYRDLRLRGLNHREACLICSHEMNHSRPEITERYLR